MKPKAPQEQTYPSGLVVEELKLGKPNGKQATPGKQVYWYSLHIWYHMVTACITRKAIKQDGSVSVIKCGCWKNQHQMGSEPTNVL